MTPHVGIPCPHCQHTLQVRVEFAGRQVRCRYCQSTFRVPGGNGQGSASGDDFPVVQSSEFPAVQSSDFPAVKTDGVLAVDGYETLGLIRNGSMGRVYRARQTSVDRVVAVKVLHQAMAGNAEYVQRFRREATFAARLAHTNVVHLIDAGDSGGCPYLVMEYADGGTVQDRIEARGPLPEAAAVAVALGVAEALDHVHRRGLIHRDVKPANVILTRDGGVKLIDFGLARLLSDEDWAAAEAGNAIGTPEYISPEQTRGQSDLDVRTDVYGLGATLYHMVTGRAPYAGTCRDVLRQHADPRARPVPPDRIAPALSAGLVGVIATMMAKNRDGRYRGCTDLIADLRRVLRNDRPQFSGVDTDTVTPAPPALSPNPQRG